MKQLKSKLKTFIRKFLTRKIHNNPSNCSLYLTETCNFKCEGCRRNIVEPHLSNEIKLDLIKKLLKTYPQIKGFCIAGLGEPTLSSEFCEILDYLKSENKYVEVITNGTNSEKFLKLKYKPDKISISLYGNNPADYLSYCKVDVFDKIVENYKILRKNFDNIGFSFILNKQNYTDLEKILDFCDSQKPQYLQLHNYLVYDIDLEKEREKVITVEDKDILVYIEKVCKGRKYEIIKPLILDLKYKKFNCISYYRIINLDGKGNIGGCMSQIPPSEKFGNILTDSDPYNSDEMINIRKGISTNKVAHNVCEYCFRRCE